MRCALSFAALLLLGACRSNDVIVPVPIAATAVAIDSQTIEITFTHEIDPTSVVSTQMRVFTTFERPVMDLAILNAQQEGQVLTVQTSPQQGGVIYAINLGPLQFTDVEEADFPAQVNFRGFGLTSVTISLNTAGFVAPDAISAMVTLDPVSGEYSEQLKAVPLALTAGEIYSATVAARIDPDRLFAARAVGSDGSPAAELATFRVADGTPIHVTLTPSLPEIPEFLPPVDPTPGNGFAPVRIVMDDRFARELRGPELRSSLDASGHFDFNSARIDAMTRVPDKGRVYEVTLDVAVDPNRRLDGTAVDTFPYVIFLIESGEDIPQRGATFIMPDETPQVIVIPIGNPSLVPVTFRIDVGKAFLDANGSQRGKYPGEGIFLTGEFPSAEDGLGRLAADAFTGGERSTLEMKARPDAQDIFEKTIFLPPNRPYGWKVLRCPTGVGCAELNRHVASSGRAFPTVMKNLTTENTDAAQSSAVRLVDPAHLDQVEMEGGSTADYSNANVSMDGTETAPNTSIMFKQEVPDLVVTVATEPVITPTLIVGTWRDVNIPQTPEEIIQSGTILDLTQYDYDDGKQGRYPLVRDINLPIDPEG